MRLNHKKGLSILEVVLSLFLISLTIIVFSSVIYRNLKNSNTYIAHSNIMDMGYNIIQILKSDSFFYEHPENYFENKDLWEIVISSTNTNIYIYFDKYNNITSKALSHSTLNINYTITNSTNWTVIYYAIKTLEKNSNYIDYRVGNLEYVYKTESK